MNLYVMRSRRYKLLQTFSILNLACMPRSNSNSNEAERLGADGGYKFALEYIRRGVQRQVETRDARVCSWQMQIVGRTHSDRRWRRKALLAGRKRGHWCPKVELNMRRSHHRFRLSKCCCFTLYTARVRISREKNLNYTNTRADQ